MGRHAGLCGCEETCKLDAWKLSFKIDGATHLVGCLHMQIKLLGVLVVLAHI